MRTLRVLLIFGAVCLISSCGGSDEEDSTSSEATTTAPATDASGGTDVGTLIIDGESNDVVLGDEVVLSSWEEQVPRDPCALEGDAISLVLRTIDEGRFTFVAEGPSATDLALTLVDNHMTLGWTTEAATATIGDGTFEYAGTLTDPDSEESRAVEVSVTC